ncbi:hypothetical protein [Blattabacterium cuenoti]|uniref:hypothetical protein n=1 Tax=Blattabacterium cuenoti TaxID=1653831 RepID=UPI00163C9A7A|nr:hypothetical protein [Blattabacterium cuenoti]
MNIIKYWYSIILFILAIFSISCDTKVVDINEKENVSLMNKILKEKELQELKEYEKKLDNKYKSLRKKDPKYINEFDKLDSEFFLNIKLKNLKEKMSNISDNLNIDKYIFEYDEKIDRYKNNIKRKIV